MVILIKYYIQLPLYDIKIFTVFSIIWNQKSQHKVKVDQSSEESSDESFDESSDESDEEPQKKKLKAPVVFGF